jgi:hypothetical protein
MMYSITPELLGTITGGVVGNAPQHAQSAIADVGEKLAPKDCNSELGFGVMLTGAEVGGHTPGPWWLKMSAAAVGAVSGLYAGCRMGRPTNAK